jgi:hypothetical protein
MDAQTPLTPPSSAPKGIPLAAIIDLIENKGNSIAATARLLGCNKSNITTRLQQAGLTPGYLKEYKDNRADIFATYQHMVLNYLTPAKLKSAGVVALNALFGTLYDKERLERGQSTENIAYLDIVKAQKIVDKKVLEFEGKWKAGQ